MIPSQDIFDAPSVWAALTRVTDRQPDSIALSWSTGRLSYRELTEVAMAVAGSLAAEAAPGDTVLIRCGNHPGAAVLWLASVCARLVPCLMNEGLEPSARESISRAITPAIGAEALGPARTDPLDGITVTTGGGKLALGATDRIALPDSPAPDDIVEISCSSGTTGVPKVLSFTHRACLYSRRCWISHLRLGPDDVVYLFMPFSHASGLRNSFLAALLAGGRCHLVATFDAAGFWTDVADACATFFMFHERSAAALLDVPPGPGDRLHQVRLACGAAGEVARIEAFEERFGVRTLQNYGLSETGSVTSPDPALDLTALAARRRFAPDGVYVGEPLGDRTQVELRSSDGRRVERPGEAGEFWISTPAACKTIGQLTTEGGWLASGDLGVLGPGGGLHYIGRIADVIIRRGERIRLTSVDDALAGLPSVRDAAVRNEEDGRLCAYVVPADTDVWIADVLAACQATLPFAIQPEQVVLVPAIPRNAMGRVIRSRLA